MKVSTRELKNRLSRYLKRAQAGKEVVVTSHGRPVVRLAPVTAAKEDEESAAIERINAQAWVRRGLGRKPKGATRPIPWKPREKMLSEIVLDERE